MSPPSLVIVIPLESALKLMVAAMNDSETARLWQWIEAHGQLFELVERAIELSNDEAA